MNVEVLGVHPVEAPEPCHLVELQVDQAEASFEIDAVTQETPGQPRDNWQVPWDEHFLNSDGSALFNPTAPELRPSVAKFRVAFFFHYLDLGRPLLTPSGAVVLPSPSPRPPRLAFLRYESPC